MISKKQPSKNGDVTHSTFVGDFQLMVLESINFLGQNAYGMRIRNHLNELMEREIHMPQVYTALTRLQKLGFITSSIDPDASAGKRGRARRVYNLKAPGQRMLDASTILTSKPGLSNMGDKSYETKLKWLTT